MFRVLMATALLVFAGAAQADDDVIRLKLPELDPTAHTLGLTSTDEAATIATRHGHGGYHGGHGGYRGGYGHYRGGYGGYGGYRGYYGGYRGYRGGYYGGGYRSYYRPYYGGYRSYYRPYYGGYGIGIGYGGYGYSSYGIGYGLGYGGYGIGYGGYGYSSYGYPCSASVSVIAPTTSLAVRPATTIAPVPTIPAMPRADGTFDYNGGPKAPVPMPPAAEEQARELPRTPTPVIDRVVSLRIAPKTGKWVYPAYGETPRRTGR